MKSEDVCRIYDLLHDNGLVSFPRTAGATQKIDSLVSNINGSSYGLENYPAVEVKAVAYLYFLVKNHPFTDGNKRTAVLTFLVLCEMNGLIRSDETKHIGLDELAVFIEEFKTDDHQLFIQNLAEIIF